MRFRGDITFLRRWLMASVIVAVMVGAMAVIQLSSVLFDDHVDAAVVVSTWCNSNAVSKGRWDAEIIEGPTVSVCVIRNVTIEMKVDAITVRQGQQELTVPRALYIGPAVVHRPDRRVRLSGSTFVGLIIALAVVAFGAGWVIAKCYRSASRPTGPL